MAKPPSSHDSPWTRQDFAMIRKLVREGIPTRKIAKALGRTLASLYERAAMKVSRSHDRSAERRSQGELDGKRRLVLTGSEHSHRPCFQQRSRLLKLPHLA